LDIDGRSRSNGVILFVICLLGLTVRMALALQFPGVAHPDETIQYLEQANRVVTGRGLVPWEYLAEVRSWLIPGMLIPIIALARLVSTTPETINIAIAVASSLFSLGIIAGAFVIANEKSGRAAALSAAGLAAFWPEIVYLSPHILADSLSAVTLVVGLSFGYREVASRRALAACGFFLALTVLLRPQLAPAAAIAWIWIGGFSDWRRYIPLAISGFVAIVIFGIIDWLTLGAPFESIYRYVVANSAGVAASFGVSNNRYYIASEVQLWGFAMVPILYTGALGARRAPLVAVVGAVVLLTFSLVGHKEDRFIYPAIPLVFILCGIGTSEIAGRSKGWSLFEKPWAIAAATIVFWGGTAAYVGFRPPMTERFDQGRAALAAIQYINRDPSACSVALDPAWAWWRTGLVRFRSDIELYELGERPLPGPQAYNVILSVPGALRTPEYRAAGFVSAGCFTHGLRACVFRRETACDPKQGSRLRATPDDGVVQVLKKIGFSYR
jgi:phosphatidylinositol glycan class B